MPRRDLTEHQMRELEYWLAQHIEPERAAQILQLMAEVRAQRERESATRFLMAIEGEV